ncbi:MAG TPA: hypothetical protein VF427_14180 [Noviherbaspirillum sp.]
MKKLSLVLAIVLLAGCAGMSGAPGSGAENPSMDLRSRDHAFDLYFG